MNITVWLDALVAGVVGGALLPTGGIVAIPVCVTVLDNCSDGTS